MNLTINGEVIELVYSFRSSIYFEQIAGHNIEFDRFSANDLLILFYSVTIASLQKQKKPVISMLDFLDIVDENGGEKCLIEFSTWYTKIVTDQFEAINNPEEEPKKKKTGKKKTN